MLRHRNTLPLDYSLCAQTVTVRSAGGQSRVLANVHYEFTDRVDTTLGAAEHSREFLLVIPGPGPIAPGDRVYLGSGPVLGETTVQMPTLGVVKTVKPRFFKNRLCHTEARG